MKHTKTYPYILILAVLSLIPFCSKKQTPVEKGIEDQVLHFGNQVEPEDLDPHIVTGVGEFHIISSLLEGLVVPDPKTLEPLPGAASSWEISDDGLEYTFHFRSDGRWSNGDPVTAHDFVFSFQRILSPALAAEYAYMLYCIHGAEAYHKGELTKFSLVGVKALDDSTLYIKLARPIPYFLSLIIHHSWYPVHPPTIKKFGTMDERGTKWTQPGNYVGNGPFVLETWDIGSIIKVKKNSTYWDNENVRLLAIHFHPIENQQTEERSFRTGQLHLTTGCPLNKIEWYEENKPELLRIDPYLGTYYYLVNVTRPPFDDIHVRKALAMAIDRNAITEHVLKAGELPAHYFTPTNTNGYTCTTEVSFDTTEARRLLREAGYSEENPFPAFSLLYNTSESHHTVAQAIQQMWKQYLGIDVTLVNQEWKVYLSSTNSMDYDVARMGWIGDYNDPTTFLDMWVTGGGNNRTGWSNTIYDSLITKAGRTADKQERFTSFQSAEHILIDELPILPIYFYTNAYLLHPSVKGWYPNLLNWHPYKFVYLE